MGHGVTLRDCRGSEVLAPNLSGELPTIVAASLDTRNPAGCGTYGAKTGTVKG